MSPSPAVDWALSAAVSPAFSRSPWLLFARALVISWCLTGTVMLLRVQRIALQAGRPMLQLALEGLGVIGFVAVLAFLGTARTDAAHTLTLIRRLEGLAPVEARLHALIALRHLSYLLVLPALWFGLVCTATPRMSDLGHGLVGWVGSLVYGCGLAIILSLSVLVVRTLHAQHARKILVGLVAVPSLLHTVWPELMSPALVLRQFAAFCLSLPFAA